MLKSGANWKSSSLSSVKQTVHEIIAEETEDSLRSKVRYSAAANVLV